MVLMGWCVLVHANLRAQDTTRYALLDKLLPALEGVGTDSNLVRIDRALLAAGPDAEPRLVYFLRRYRCEQLYYQGLFTESMIDAERARRIAENLKDSLLIASSLNQIAVLREEQNDDQGAIELLNNALRWYPNDATTPYPLTTPHRIHGNLGLCWANLGILDSAFAHQSRSLHLAQAANIPRGQALALLKLGQLQLDRAQPDSARSTFLRARAIAMEHRIHDVALDLFPAMADALQQAGLHDPAHEELKHAERFLSAHPDVAQRSVVEFHDQAFRIHADAGRYAEALRAAHTWRALDGSLRITSARTAQRTLATIRRTDAELANERVQLDLVAAEVASEERIQRTLLLGGITALLLLGALVVVYIGRERQKDRIARLALHTLEQDRLIAELRVRQQVSADLHDDLGAGLSALKLQNELAVDLSPDEATRARNTTGARIAEDLVASMRHILWSLNHTDATVRDLVTYVSDQARSLCAQHERSIQVRTTGPWPDAMAPAKLRHHAWTRCKDTLRTLLRSPEGTPITLELDWNEGLLMRLVLEGDADQALRAEIAANLATNQVRMAAIGASVRASTEGAVSAEIFLPLRNAVGNEASPFRAPGTAVPVLLALMMGCWAMHEGHAQPSIGNHATHSLVRTIADSIVAPTARRDDRAEAIERYERTGKEKEAVLAWREWQRSDSAIRADEERASLELLKTMLDNDQRLEAGRADRARHETLVRIGREQRAVLIGAIGTGALLLLIVLAVYMGRQRNARTLMAMELKSSASEKELADLRIRRRVSEEMHEEIGAGLSALKVRSELALELETDTKNRERLLHQVTMTGDLLASLRQIIWALDSGRSTLRETVAFTEHYARSYGEQQGLPLIVSIDTAWPDLQLSMEQRRNIFLVVKEAMHNTVKHAQASEAGLSVHWRNGLTVEISDNGRGFVPDNSSVSGNGLRNMRKRIESIGGSFELKSASGTRVIFSVPLKATEANKSSIRNALA